MVDLEVPRVFSQNRVLPPLWSRSLTFQLQVVVFREVFKVFAQERSSTAFGGAEHRFPAATRRATLTFQFPEVACTVSLFMALLAHPQYRVMCVGTLPLRTRGRNCLRTRAHGRGLLDVPMVLEEEESEDEPDFAVESWSMMGAGGGASGAQLASGIAGGWPLPMGPRLAILSGGLHGLSAAAQGDDAMEELLSWCLVRQWIQVPAVAELWRCLFQFIVRVVDTAVMLQRQVRTVSNCARSSTTLSHGSEAVSLGPVQQTTEIPQLHSIDKVFDVPLVQSPADPVAAC